MLSATVGRGGRAETGTHAITAAVAAVRCAPGPSTRLPPQQQCSVPRVVTAEKPTVERSAEKIIPLDVRVCIDKGTEGKMKPERGALESQQADTGPGAPGEQCLSSWEMQQTTVADCLLADGSSDLGENTSSLQNFVIGVKPRNQTFPLASSQNLVFLQMSYKPGDSK